MSAIHSPRRSHGVVGALTLLVAAGIVPGPAAAQVTAPPGILALTVRDSTGAGIADAQLMVAGTAVRGETDDRGNVRLANVPSGIVRVDVRRLGYRATWERVSVQAGASTSTTITLMRVAQQLSPILVRGSANAHSARLAGFYERRARGIGHFFTRSDIEHQHVMEFTDLFRRIPGMRIMSTDIIQHAIRMRGASCAPLVWMDGLPLAAAEFDLDVLSPESVEAMEVYSGIAEIPPGLMGPHGLGSCGVIVVWSREGERRPKSSKRTVTAAQLAELVDSLKVYTASEVDVAARPDTTVSVQPAYPESLFAAHVGGRVTAEFVVDTTGEVLMQTFGAISSTNPAFTEAVRRVLLNAAYIPASLNGRLVKQVVYQPFTFIADSSATPLRQ